MTTVHLEIVKEILKQYIKMHIYTIFHDIIATVFFLKGCYCQEGPNILGPPGP